MTKYNNKYIPIKEKRARKGALVKMKTQEEILKVTPWFRSRDVYDVLLGKVLTVDHIHGPYVYVTGNPYLSLPKLWFE